MRFTGSIFIMTNNRVLAIDDENKFVKTPLCEIYNKDLVYFRQRDGYRIVKNRYGSCGFHTQEELTAILEKMKNE